MFTKSHLKKISATVVAFMMLTAAQSSYALDALSSATQTEYKDSTSTSEAVPTSTTTSPAKTETNQHTTATGNNAEFHTVKTGDVMWKIAKSHGMTLDALIKLNPEIKNPNRIFIGQLIKIGTMVKEQAKDQSNAQVIVHVNTAYANGVYRGAFIDGGYQQVGVEFTVLNGKIEKIDYKVLKYKDEDYLKSDKAIIQAMAAQYGDLLKGIIGKDVEEGIKLLHSPEKLAKDAKVGTDVVTGATLRSTKVSSAIKDALIRGPYRVLPTSIAYDDGVYRGAYVDGGNQQVGVEFKLLDNKVTSISYKVLSYKDVNYMKPDAGSKFELLKTQYDALIEYLLGKDVRLHLNVLHYPSLIADDLGEGADAVSGATLRSAKVISSVQDALNRGVYRYEGSTSPSQAIYLKNYENGVYRGSYFDSNEQQVSIQFSLTDNKISNLSYRVLAYKKVNYLKDVETPKVSEFLTQYNQLLSYMEGKSLVAVVDLYAPGNIAKDVIVGSDVVTGASIRSAKVISAINDALNRGVYMKSK